MTASGERSAPEALTADSAAPVVLATDRDGGQHTVELTAGQSLMRTLKYDGGLDVEAICGGNAICGTCHVYVDPEWYPRLPAPGEMETELLDQLVFTVGYSRLACQITCEPGISGLRVTLAPQE
jgi:2Fe-2S ferredoxin